MGPEGRDIYRLIGFFWDTAYPFCYTTFMVTGLQLVRLLIRSTYTVLYWYYVYYDMNILLPSSQSPSHLPDPLFQVFGVKPWTFLVYFIFLSDLAENYVAGRLMAAFPFASMTDPQLVSLANLYSIFKFIKFLLYIPTMVLTLVLLLNLIFRTLFCGGGQKNRTTSLKKKGE